MDRLRIAGGAALDGEIPIGGAKNAALPLMAASLLTAEPLELTNVPRLRDVGTLIKVLEQHGVEVEAGPGTLRLTAADIPNTMAPYDLVRQMRASVLVLGPLVARFGNSAVSLPGGCAIGSRPIDLHLMALEQLGAEISLGRGYIHAEAPPGGLVGNRIIFPKVSVGASENAIMAATLARGTTVIENAALEPEVADLADCLNAMGARIEGIGSERLVIEGVDELHGAQHRVVADRIEAGTYAMAAAITGGAVTLQNVGEDLFGAAAAALREAGVALEPNGAGIRVSCTAGDLTGVDVITDPFPGFPTDLQAQFMALMSKAGGASMITETIFENRYMHVPELKRMGANVNLHGASAMVRGVERLYGAEVMATDLRASSSLVIAALAAEGETTINRVYHLDRGYERLVEKLTGCGARVERIAGS
ncbi:MAG: UDP-N-acetylglucosamine 1-carboxyvinyltransferase [Rhodospirillaceae bacterium]|nr:UDP-N-acetylglucosamine 1-carboxyvinyltransferase [Rhodospirillaceae bacterium]MYB12466.1 UDP-N-acetylglucosamine 1-carboxyvinyltransferase [Rhodospirillaceae bacterium]MYI51118.1 UDP-N-acetylglucosamine 1-carboxyvinyltransferase [Rhodospirillaceae bacterium]